jgi:hypothetical protein
MSMDLANVCRLFRASDDFMPRDRLYEHGRRTGEAKSIKARAEIRKLELENLDDPAAHSVAREIGHGMEIELAHEVGAMSLRRLDAEAQSHSHFLAGLSLSQQLDDFAFARR